MIKVVKNLDNVPTILKKANREEAFNSNVSKKGYVDSKNLYKVGSVQKVLNDLYHLKCAYCERKLLDAPKHIEHYRTKDIYYWLAYSWDNLLLCCGSCNSSKGKRFEIKHTQIEYSNELFKNIHNLNIDYDKKEEPKIINPEKDDVLELIVFNIDAQIDSADTRVYHTIHNACKLNREELVKLRLEIINDFRNSLDEHFNLFLGYGDITRFLPDIKLFQEKCKVQNEFYAFRYFILNHIELFIVDNLPLQIIVKNLIEKYTNE
jgi:uncharacterized protein (TIGR02646 family)